ncbi:hypothetical protein Hanom_Chr12g01101601 [Helianthus anomalus]
MSGDQRRLDPEEWEQPRHRKGRRNDYQVEGNNKVLGRYGRYEGPYIARKLDKWGKRFAFVSFSEVRDIIRLEEELSDVWAVNIQREKTTLTNDKSHAKPSCEGADGNRSFNAKVGNGRSFVDSLLNKNKVDVLKVDDSVERFTHWNSCALAGRVVNFNTLGSLKFLIRKQGWISLDIKYLGGLSVALVFYDKGDADKFLNDKSLWSVWYESLDWWAANFSVEEGRIAWLQVHGLPAQLALDQVYNMIGSRHGKVVQSASLSGDDNNFSYALIGVLSKECIVVLIHSCIKTVQ